MSPEPAPQQVGGKLVLDGKQGAVSDEQVCDVVRTLLNGDILASSERKA